MKSRSEFIKALKYELRLLNADEKEELLSFYEDRFENAKFEGKTEKDIINELESPSQIANNVYDQYGINPHALNEPRPESTGVWSVIKVLLIDLFFAIWAVPALYSITFGMALSLVTIPFVFSGMSNYSLAANTLNIMFSLAAYFLTFALVLVLIDLTIRFTCWLAQLHIRLVNIETADRIKRFPNEFSVRRYLQTKKWKMNLLVPVAIVILIVSPIIYFGNGYSQSSWFGVPRNTGVIEETFYYDYDLDTSLDFNVVTADITYKVANIDQVKVDVKYQKGSKLYVSKSGNEIEVRRERMYFNINAFSLFSFDNISRPASIVVTIPQQAILFDIDFETVSGEIVIEQAIARTAALNSISGAVEVKGSQIGELAVTTVSGRIQIQANRSDRIKVESVSGDVSLEDCGVVLNGIKINTVSGDTEIRNVDDSIIKIDSVSGDATYYVGNESKRSNVDFNSVSGDFRIQ